MMEMLAWLVGGMFAGFLIHAMLSPYAREIGSLRREARRLRREVRRLRMQRVEMDELLAMQRARRTNPMGGHWCSPPQTDPPPAPPPSRPISPPPPRKRT